MLPQTKVNKKDGNTGVVKPGSKGICAIIAPCEKGTAALASMHVKPDLAVAEFGSGVLTEGAAYVMQITGNPVLCIRATASTAGTYGTVSHSGAGSSVATATVGAPFDDFEIVVKFVAGGTVGVAGATYQVSINGGRDFGPVTALGTGNTIAIPTTGATLSLAAGTVLAGQTESFKTTGPRLTSGDISAALEALRISSQPWEFVLVLGHDASSTTISTLDAWLTAREKEGRFRGFIVNGAMKGATSESAYTTAMDTAFSASASIRGCVAADGGAFVSVIPGRAGYRTARPTSLAFAARLMAIPYGTDAALVSDNPIPGFELGDGKGNPVYHDEALYPNLDDLRLVTLRTFDRRAGVYLTNPNVISPTGSDYVYAQHIRTMNRACEIAFDILTTNLSKGVRENPKIGPNNEKYIDEGDAQTMDDLVNTALNELRGQVNDLRFKLSRTDDIGANGPVTINAELMVDSLSYIKQFNVNASFVRAISTQA